MPKQTISAKRLLREVRRKCLDCVDGAIKEIRLCPVTGCPLWPWRFGDKTYRTPEEYLDPAQIRRLGFEETKREMGGDLPDDWVEATLAAYNAQESKNGAPRGTISRPRLAS